MDKQDEKVKLREFIAGLPKVGYLRPILEQIQLDVENAITNDFVFVDFRGQIEAQRVHVAEIAGLQQRINDLKAECRKLDHERARVVAAIDVVRSEARTLARLASQSH